MSNMGRESRKTGRNVADICIFCTFARNLISDMEQLKHECGVAMVRLLKPLSYYQEKYGTWMYGLNKLYLMMEKQHNRGQEGAGLASVKLASLPGEEYMFRERALGTTAISEIFSSIYKQYQGLPKEQLSDAEYAERYLPFAGEIYMGHLRYSTTGKSGLSYVHPFLRRDGWRARNLCICGNFNMTNVDEIFSHITADGQHPRVFSDTFILLEQLVHRLDRESDRLYKEACGKQLQGTDITQYIENHLDITNVLRQTSDLWDGGYVICGLTGSGEMFAQRDPWGIRPAFWYKDDEILVLASERPVIQTALNVEIADVHELSPGQAIVVHKNGEMEIQQILPPQKIRQCSFERIYFSRGSDEDIYQERKKLGCQLVEPILKAIDYDVRHTVFSYIPNTAESAFYGLIEGFESYVNQQKFQKLSQMKHVPTNDELTQILNEKVRCEKVAWKDIKMRTFIAEGNTRNDMVAHVYDITYGCLKPYVDNLVIIDDSIVRGTTLRESIIRILDRLHPKKLVIVSSSPQVRFPDYYGIDMARLDEFIAFKVAIELLRERGKESLIMDVYAKCKHQQDYPKEKIFNYVKEIYAPFSDEEISRKMADILRHKDVKTDISIVFQSIEGLRAACPGHTGDWYFSGDYPTAGGNKRVNQAYIDYIENVYANNTKIEITH